MKWRQACLLMVACLVICYTIWVLLPSSHYEAESQQIVANVTQARAELQRRAKDPQQNGYLDPEFLPLWEARRVDPANAKVAQSSAKENQPPCQIRSLLEATSPLCDLSQGKKTELQALVSQNKTDQLRSIREFEAFYPKIQAVENRPVFVVPDDQPLGYSSPHWNYQDLKNLALGCATLTDYQTLSKQGDQALQTCQDSLKFSHTLGCSSEALMHLMIADELHELAHKSLCMVLQSDLKFSLNSLESLRQTLEQTQLPSRMLPETAKSEFCAGLNLWEETRTATNLQLTWDRMPGIWARELRMFKNDFIPLIHQIQANAGGHLSFRTDLWGWLLGRHGWYSSQLIPNFSGARELLNVSQKRHALLHLYVSLRIYRLHNGQWPQSISQLTSSGYKPLEGLDLAQAHYQVEGEKIRLELESESESESTQANKMFKTPTEGLEKWQILSGPRWILH